MTLSRMHAIALPLVVGLSVLSYSVADGDPIYVFVALPVIITALLINSGPRATPLPRWIINILVVIATVVLIANWGGDFNTVINVICQYLILLQLLKLFEPARHRDQSQLIMLGVMLVIGSMLTSVTAELGLVLLIYFPTLLWTILVHQIQPPPEVGSSIAADTGPIARAGSLKRDLARTTFVCGLFIAMLTAMVFITMPRGMGTPAGIGSWASNVRADAVTGFSNQVKLGASGLLSESTRVVLEVDLETDDESMLTGQSPVLLRGAVLDYYDRERGEWRVSYGSNPRGPPRMSLSTGSNRLMFEPGDVIGEVPPDLEPLHTQHITVLSPVVHNLFSMWRPQTLRLDSAKRVLMQRDDYRGVFEARIARNTPALTYTVVSAPTDLSPSRRYIYDWLTVNGNPGWPPRERAWRTATSATGWSLRFRDLPVSAFASRRPEVEPEFASNPFVGTPIQALAEGILDQEQIDLDQPTDRTSELAAGAFRDYLQSSFLYTTEMLAPAPGQDPIEMFLFDPDHGGRGHCEYFASALAAMCLSVGIPARVVTGYVASETNGAGHFTVRENHAHAWTDVEVRPRVWREFDPSPQEVVQRLHSAAPGLIARAGRVFDFFRLAWVRNVVTYNQEAQSELFEDARDGPLRTLRSLNGWVGRQLLGTSGDGSAVSTGVLGATARSFLTVLVLSTVLGVGIFVAVAAAPPLTRRLRASLSLSDPTLASLRSPTQRTMVHLIRRAQRALGRRGLGAPQSTPLLTHARALSDLHPEIGSDTIRLAELYYESRFSGRELAPQRIDEARALVERIVVRCRPLARNGAARHNGPHVQRA